MCDNTSMIKRICEFAGRNLSKDLVLNGFALGWICGVNEAAVHTKHVPEVIKMLLEFNNREIGLEGTL